MEENPPTRLLSAEDQYLARLKEAPKRLAFTKGANFGQWKNELKSKVWDLLDPFPEPVHPNLEILEDRIIDDFVDAGLPPFTQQKIIYDTERFGSCVAYLLIPGDIDKDEKRPAILNAHGHGSGKKKLVGLDEESWPEDPRSPGMPNFEAMSLHLVKAGYVVIAPDWRPFGERALHPDITRPDRDPCNVLYLAFGYFGYSLLTLNVWDAMRTIDVLESMPYVDKNRIGMIGKSYGGTMTTYTTVLDDRVRVAVISGYLSTLDDALGFRGKGNTCGAQYVPGLLNWADIPDVIGLIAPRPLLIESGTQDDCFNFEDTTKAYGHLQDIYKASGHPDKLDRDVADVGHQYIGNKFLEFFQNHL
jgi:hypothetical protein